MNTKISNKAVGHSPAVWSSTDNEWGPDRCLYTNTGNAYNWLPPDSNWNARRDDVAHRGGLPVSHMYMQRDSATLTSIL